MNEIISNPRIKDTGWSKISKFEIFFISLTFIFMDIIIPYLILFIFPKFVEGRIALNTYIFLAIIYNSPLIYLVIRTVRSISPIQKTRIIFSNTELKIFIQNSLYFQISMNDIKTIEFIKIKYIGDKVAFQGINFKKEIILFLLIFSKKKRILFKNHLKRIAGILNIEYLEIKEKTDDLEVLQKKEKEIKKFIILNNKKK